MMSSTWKRSWRVSCCILVDLEGTLHGRDRYVPAQNRWRARVQDRDKDRGEIAGRRLSMFCSHDLKYMVASYMFHCPLF